MAMRVQQTLFFIGLILLGLTYIFPPTWLYFTWCLFAAVVTEGLLAQWLVREIVQMNPTSGFWDRIAPATLPLVIMLIAAFRMAGVVSGHDVPM